MLWQVTCAIQLFQNPLFPGRVPCTDWLLLSEMAAPLTSEQTQIQGQLCFQNKSKYSGAQQQTDKCCASRGTPQSLEKLTFLIFENKSWPCAEAQGAGWALHRSSCYWATFAGIQSRLSHSIMEQSGLEGTLKISSIQTPLAWAGTFCPRPDCSKPHHVRQIPQRALWKAHTGISKIDLRIHTTCIPVNDSIFMH